MSKKSDKDIDKIIDNGLKRNALMEKYGAVFGGESSLDPELEAQWLDYLEAFESRYENAARITLFKLVGEPTFKPLNELTDEEFPKELDRLYQLLIEHEISFDTLADVDDREIYRFIIEELFYEEMDDLQIPGLMSCFIYEDFHPNATLDIELAIDTFFISTLGKDDNISGTGYDFTYIDTENYLNAEGKEIPKEQIERQITNFLKSFDSFEIIKRDVVDFQVNEDETDAIVKMDMAYIAWIEKGKAHEKYSGIAVLKLQPSPYGGWGIYQIDMPGWLGGI